MRKQWCRWRWSNGQGYEGDFYVLFTTEEVALGCEPTSVVSCLLQHPSSGAPHADYYHSYLLYHQPVTDKHCMR